MDVQVALTEAEKEDLPDNARKERGLQYSEEADDNAKPMRMKYIKELRRNHNVNKNSYIYIIHKDHY